MDTEILLIGLQISAIGLSVVFSALIGITIIVSNFDRLDNLLTRKPAAPEVAAPTSPPPSAPKPAVKAPEPVVDEGITPEVIVAISAAINEAITKKVQIRRVRYRSQRASSRWHVQGRASVMASRSTVRNRN